MLTHTQKLIFSAIASSKLLKEIADDLGIAEVTVSFHVRKALAAAGIEGSAGNGGTRARITRYAAENGLITIGPEGQVIDSFYESAPHCTDRPYSTRRVLLAKADATAHARSCGPRRSTRLGSRSGSRASQGVDDSGSISPRRF